jgi:hypothetical protein
MKQRGMCGKVRRAPDGIRAPEPLHAANSGFEIDGW